MTYLRVFGAGSVWVLALSAGCGHTELKRVGNITTGEAGAAGADGSNVGGGDAEQPATGAVGGGGSGGYQAPRGGGAGFPEGGQPTEFDCEDCEELATGVEISAIAATDSEVLWTEHGSHDALGNYQDDGRLLVMPAGGGETSVLLEGLKGPVQLAVSSAYAYLLLDEAGAGGQYQLARALRAGGSVEPVATVAIASDNPELTPYAEWLHTSFATAGGYAFWFDGAHVKRLAESEEALAETTLEAEGVTSLLADATALYFSDAQGLWSVPVAGGEPVLLAEFDDPDSEYGAFTVSGDIIYAVEHFANGVDAQQTYVARLPKTGGEWKRVASLADQTYRLIVTGDHFVSDSPKRSGSRLGRRLMQGRLDAPGSLVQVARAPVGPTGERVWHSWSAASSGVFLETEDKLYRVPLSP